MYQLRKRMKQKRCIIEIILVVFYMIGKTDLY